ncbi:hypothetical protein NMY22_g9551 [Coprinellus aureogranulatus]|nr:hypothetical protein NMY22_g9551 [Coprinellus aureogranulatus]
MLVIYYTSDRWYRERTSMIDIAKIIEDGYTRYVTTLEVALVAEEGPIQATWTRSDGSQSRGWNPANEKHMLFG